jgi:hypothetical protein
MKYGLIVDFGQSLCNYGDLVQSAAIEYIYEQMGIPSTQIVRLTKKDLSDYDGELILLPFSYTIFYLINFKTKEPILSSKIIPVFLGVSIESIFIYNCIPMDVFASPNSKWPEMFKRCAPIGCRDDFTRRFLLEQNIPAYLQGCITNIFPRRTNGNYLKTLLIDCPSAALQHIPKTLLKNAEALSNVMPASIGSIEENYQRVKERYEYYRDNGAIVVTSRYHVALPCNAMGIPSIVIKPPKSKYIEDIRWDTIPPQVQVCSSLDDLKNAVWDIRHEDFLDIKQLITDIATARIGEAYMRHSTTNDIHAFFKPNLDRYKNNMTNHTNYKHIMQDYGRRNHLNTNGHFYIWGAVENLCYGNIVELADIVTAINPKLKFAGWIDSFKTGTLAGKPIYKINEINLGSEDFIIVSAESATKSALFYFSSIGIDEQNCDLLSEEMLSGDIHA